jgi:hypothetical protein
MWEPRRIATLWTSMACYRDSFTPYYVETFISWNKLPSKSRFEVSTAVTKMAIFCDVTPCGSAGFHSNFWGTRVVCLLFLLVSCLAYSSNKKMEEMFLRNVTELLPNYVVQQPRRSYFSSNLLNYAIWRTRLPTTELHEVIMCDDEFHKTAKQVQ